MAVIEITERNEGRDGTIDYQQRSYRRSFQVETSNPYDGPLTVISAVSSTQGITIGTPYTMGTESDPWAVCLKMNATPFGEDQREWIVTVEYGRAPNVAENPLSEPSELDIEGREFEVAIDRDRNGNPLVNSAGDPFDPPVTIEDNRIIVTVARNEATPQYAAANPGYVGPVFNYADLTGMVGKTNQTTFLGYGPRKLKALFPRISREFSPNIGFYWKVIYRFEIIDKEYEIDDPDNPGTPLVIGQGHDRVILDQGFREKVGSVKKLITLDGQPLQEPALLDGSGEKLPEGDSPRYLAFQVLPEHDFAGMGFTFA